MADDCGRLNEILAETSFLYGGKAGLVEDLRGRWAADPASVEPSWAAFFATLSDSPDAVRGSATPPSWTPAPFAPARPDWLSAIDGLWPAVEAKLKAPIETPHPPPNPHAVPPPTLPSLP